MVEPRAFAWKRPGQCSGGAGEVMADSRAGQPGAGGEVFRREVGQRAVAEVREDLLDDRVVAVLGLGLDHPERRVRKHGVIASGGNSSSCLHADALDIRAGCAGVPR